MKQILTLSMILLVSLLTACSNFIQTVGADEYYVQVPEEGRAFDEQGNTRYEYTVEGYDEDGESMSLNFTANKSLGENAYLKIDYKKDEVITYEEVQSDQVPEKALDQLGNG